MPSWKLILPRRDNPGPGIPSAMDPMHLGPFPVSRNGRTGVCFSVKKKKKKKKKNQKKKEKQLVILVSFRFVLSHRPPSRSCFQVHFQVRFNDTEKHGAKAQLKGIEIWPKYQTEFSEVLANYLGLKSSNFQPKFDLIIGREIDQILIEGRTEMNWKLIQIFPIKSIQFSC